MFHKYTNYIMAWAVAIPLLTGLTACSEGKTLETFLGADPQLKSASEKSTTTKPIPQKNETSQSDNENNQASPISPTSKISESTQAKSAEELESSQKIDNFPPIIPIYPQAELIKFDAVSTEEKGKTTWRSSAPIDDIISFYQQQFQENQWEFIQNPTSESSGEDAVIAIKDNLEVVLFLYPSPVEGKNNAAETEFTLEYQPTDNIIEQATETTTTTETEESPASLESIAIIPFSDLNETPNQLAQYVRDVATLGVLTPYEEDGKVDLSQFAPNKPVTRREYARWLVNINNRFYASSSGNKIHLATKSDQPAFKDINYNDPDYEIIQGLAEAGLIPSRLTNNSSKLLFQPDAPLTRENLLIWKVPLDLRKALPPASIEAISDSWGFQDATSIEPQGLRALFADFQNGEQANINRVFGYTTLFQPKKPVTRAEAAASLWYFGFQGEGINAQEAFKLQEEE